MLAKLLDYRFLLPIGLLVGFSPFVPQPHLVGKLAMLLKGELVRPIDILDLFWHGSPLLLIGFRLGRDLGRRMQGKTEQADQA